ncbi:hypothetical protein GALMADRAFT_149215 [Galerina marginata CBS 339.88]|uniref:Uncharacterized protein n=1 Tax=Galerina marginata (strain CBS 339.88) TaxID=685588 RepID=A0A067S4S5_GALM3|nr:hypothetical protein GALMADRAFT_149215 [Galerina marginata CBS 339.88]
MGKSQRKKQASYDVPYRRRSARLQKDSQVNIQDNISISIKSDVKERNKTVDEAPSTNSSHHTQIEDETLKQYIINNTEAGQYNREALRLLWKGNIQTIINRSLDSDEEARRHALCVVRQVASCLNLDLGATIPVPVGKNRALAKPSYQEVQKSSPLLSEDLAFKSKELWNKWGTTKSLVDLLDLAEEDETNEKNVQAFVQILAKSVGILTCNIINEVTYAVQASAISSLPISIQAKIFDHFSVVDHQSFAETSKSHFLSMNQYHCNMLADMLANFGFRFELFMSALQDCKALVTGSFALQPLLPNNQRFFTNNIDIVMSSQHLHLFQTKVLTGYKHCIPTTKFHTYNPLITDRIIFEPQNIKASVCILLVKDGHSSLESIFYQPTTSMMNAITSSETDCLLEDAKPIKSLPTYTTSILKEDFWQHLICMTLKLAKAQ